MDKPKVRPRRGRPLSFDRRRALETALSLFQARGYEGTSVANLVAAMGITPPSLYAAFGSKEQLFREAISLYLAEEGAFAARALAEEETARGAIARMLHQAAEIYPARSTRSAGCLVSTSVLACAPENDAVARELAALRIASRTALQARLDRARDENELPADASTEGLAAFYAATIQGMSVQARDGADATALHRIADAALRAWPN